MGVDDQLFGIITSWNTECGGDADRHSGIGVAGFVFFLRIIAGRNDLCAFIAGWDRLGAQTGQTDEGDGMDHFFIILALAVGSFIAAMHEGAAAKNVLLNNNMHRFLLGMLMCAINPVQIPFWFGWSTVLFTKKILSPVPMQYNSYIIGIGLGTLLGNAVFIFGGKYLVSRIANSEQYLNWVIGGIFALTAILQLIKILRHKDAAEQLRIEN